MRWSLPAVLLLALGLPLAGVQVLPPGEELHTPAEEVHAAALDLARQPAGTRRTLRYLGLGNKTAKERENWRRVLAGHCNGLSRASDLVRPVAVRDWLLRIDLEDYGTSFAAAWEQLARADPFYRVKVRTPWPGGVYSDGREYAAGSFNTVKQAVAPWLAEGADAKRGIAYLVYWTESQVPLVRADWFFNYTAAQTKRAPGYYDFLGVKNEKDFQALVGFRKSTRRTELRGAIAKSGVTLEARAFVREGAEDGALWKTFDFERATDQRNPLRVLGRDIEKDYTASEQYGHLANYFWAMGLFNKQGQRIDFAPPEVASDNRSVSNDARVHVNVSCIRCHNNAGLQDLDDWHRNLYQPPLQLTATSPRDLRLARQQYLRQLESYIARDRALYEAAVKEVTGWSSKQYAAQYALAWEGTEDARVDLAWAAQDLATTPERLKAALVQALKGGRLDPVLSGLILEGKRVRALDWVQYQEIYPLAQYALRGYQP